MKAPYRLLRNLSIENLPNIHDFNTICKLTGTIRTFAGMVVLTVDVDDEDDQECVVIIQERCVG